MVPFEEIAIPEGLATFEEAVWVFEYGETFWFLIFTVTVPSGENPGFVSGNPRASYYFGEIYINASIITFKLVPDTAFNTLSIDDRVVQ